jgi:signal transduction histidine kinase
MVDQVFLSQALTNVIGNAATHSAAGAAIRITATNDGDDIEIRVEDAGPGVEPEALPHLFDRFYRAPRTAPASRQGVGLGLTVVRGLVEAMGGSVRASASDLGGLAITIRVAAARPDSEAG